jgi:hypothetical protein
VGHGGPHGVGGLSVGRGRIDASQEEGEQKNSERGRAKAAGRERHAIKDQLQLDWWVSKKSGYRSQKRKGCAQKNV